MLQKLTVADYLWRKLLYLVHHIDYLKKIDRAKFGLKLYNSLLQEVIEIDCYIGLHCYLILCVCFECARHTEKYHFVTYLKFCYIL